MKLRPVTYGTTRTRAFGMTSSYVTKLVFLLMTVVVGVVTPSLNVCAQQEASRKAKKEVPAQFPPLGRQLGLSGTVRVAVVISPEGKVKSAHAVGGPPLFMAPAEEAAKQWEFEPNSKETKQVVEFEFVKPNN